MNISNLYFVQIWRAVIKKKLCKVCSNWVTTQIRAKHKHTNENRFSAPFFNFVFFNTNPNICTSDLDHSCKFFFTKTQTH